MRDGAAVDVDDEVVPQARKPEVSGELAPLSIARDVGETTSTRIMGAEITTTSSGVRAPQRTRTSGS